MGRYLGPGLLGLGITSMMAGFMSGMAGNVSAFATVWTYDVYKPMINKRAADAHYVSMGRWCSVLGVFVAIGTAYVAMLFSNIIIYLQVLVMFFIVPLFGCVIIGMLWKRATPAAGFWGFLAGILSSIGMFIYVHAHPGGFDPVALNPDHVRYIAWYSGAKDMAVNMFTGLWAFVICSSVTLLVSLVSKPKPEAELKDLVYGLTDMPRLSSVPWHQRPKFWAAVIAVILIVVNIIFW